MTTRALSNDFIPPKHRHIQFFLQTNHLVIATEVLSNKVMYLMYCIETLNPILLPSSITGISQLYYWNVT